MHGEDETVMVLVDGEEKEQTREVRRVYEQRWSSFLHAAGILIFVSPPFMKVLGLTPTSVLAGLFLFMGEQSLSVNPILYRTFYMLTPASELPSLPPTISKGIPPTWRDYAPIHGYTAVQIIVTAVIFVVTLTKGAPAFPLIIIALVPIRLLLMNKIWDRNVLRFVDAWACKEGTPEDEQDAETQAQTDLDNGIWADELVDGMELGAMDGKSLGQSSANHGSGQNQSGASRSHR